MDSISLHKLQSGVLNTWIAAREEADRIVNSLESLLGGLSRPIILVGHSLGARIALKYASQSQIKPLRSIYALAPAVSQSEINICRVVGNVDRSVLFGYSRRDLVLQYLYPLGGQKGLLSQTIDSIKQRDLKALNLISQIVSNHIDNPPIGCVGLDVSGFAKAEVYEFNTRHTQYCPHLFQILKSAEDLL